MSYLVFARKYRPQVFGEMVGQEPIVTTLENAIRQNRVPQNFLFSPAFKNLAEVTWVQSFPFHQFDNINAVASSIPEPSTLALFTTGLAGLGFMMRRRRRST